MISIIEHIEYLMASNDCVVVPGWGALIAQHNDAKINAVAHSISKPRRNISFNASVSHNDGLLAQSIVRREGVSFDEAMRHIALNVQVFKKFMADGKEIPFGNLGYFMPNEEGNTEFIPFSRSNNCDEYFGLKQRIEIKTISEQRNEAEHNSSQHKQETTVTRERERAASQNPFRTYLRVAASFIILIALYCILSTPISVDMTHHDLAAISVPQIKQQPKQTIKVISSSTIQDKTPTAIPDSTGGKYYLVISTFRTESQAQKFISANMDMNAKIRKKGNTYRVYIDRSDDYCKLTKEINSLPSKYNEAWVSD